MKCFIWSYPLTLVSLVALAFLGVVAAIPESAVRESLLAVGRVLIVPL
jgi:hypothetical protein